MACPEAEPAVLIGNDRVVMTRWSFANGAERDGEPYFRPEGVEHDVVNGSGRAFAFLEIEIKRPTP